MDKQTMSDRTSKLRDRTLKKQNTDSFSRGDYFSETAGSSSSDTLAELDKRLKSGGKYREHLANDNSYADTPREGTPLVDNQTVEETTTRRRVSDGKRRSEVVDEKTVHKDDEGKKKRVKRRYRFKNLSNSHQISILDSQSSKQSTFFGFYTVFWLTMALVVCRSFVSNYLRFHQLFGTNIFRQLQRDLIPIALTDGLMYSSMYVSVFFQFAVKHGYIKWSRFGWVLQNVWQTVFLFFFMWLSEHMQFPWIGRVFLILHSLVMLMKQHSYSFYNGHLWRIRNELITSKKLLEHIENKDHFEEQEKVEKLKEQIQFCQEELDLQSTKTPFPENITFKNFFMYSMFPTVVYQIEYPRTDRIRWSYVFEKAAAVFGVFFLMIMVAENYLYPLTIRGLELSDAPLQERIEAYPYLLLDFTLPLFVMYLLVFYIIWHAILNGIAELTRFGDREFYGQWWNSVTWDQFAKEWNTPVHRFLLRHVYHSSISAFQVSKPTATLITFFLSSLVHELVMFSIFKKVRWYCMFFQMNQIPLIALSRLKIFRDKEVLGNVMFWFGMITGPSVMTALYLLF
jgi:sterol O-acyltransferase